MHLPDTIICLIRKLDQAGFRAWAVGGCVRDFLLGIEPHDYDLCSDALPEELSAVFFDHRLVTAGIKHGTIGVVTDMGVVEITTLRTEGNYTDSRHPEWVEFVTDIRQDLARRDFTINAIAYSPESGYVDPFGGRADLKNHILRAVGDPSARFQEDALRILRGLRFAPRFGLSIEQSTWEAMFSCTPLLDQLARERVFDELQKILCLSSRDWLIKIAPMLCRVIPELGSCVGFCQHSPHHAYDVFTHTACVVEGVPREPTLRLAALLHDIGKPACFSQDENGRGHFYGHAKRSAEIADSILQRLKAPRQLREDVLWLILHHMDLFPSDRKSLRRQLSRHGLVRLEWLLQFQYADLGGKGADEPIDAGLDALKRTLETLQALYAEEGAFSLKDLAVTGNDLIAAGFPAGPEIGKILNSLLNSVLTEELPNDRNALLQALGNYQ